MNNGLKTRMKRNGNKQNQKQLIEKSFQDRQHME